MNSGIQEFESSARHDKLLDKIKLILSEECENSVFNAKTRFLHMAVASINTSWYKSNSVQVLTYRVVVYALDLCPAI